MHGIVGGGIQNFIASRTGYLLDDTVVEAVDINDRDGDLAEAHRIVAGHLVEGWVGYEGKEGGGIDQFMSSLGSQISTPPL